MNPTWNSLDFQHSKFPVRWAISQKIKSPCELWGTSTCPSSWRQKWQGKHAEDVYFEWEMIEMMINHEISGYPIVNWHFIHFSSLLSFFWFSSCPLIFRQASRKIARCGKMSLVSCQDDLPLFESGPHLFGPLVILPLCNTDSHKYQPKYP